MNWYNVFRRIERRVVEATEVYRRIGVKCSIREEMYAVDANGRCKWIFQCQKVYFRNE